MKLTTDELKEVINCDNPMSPIRHVIYEVKVLRAGDAVINCWVMSDEGNFYSLVRTNLHEMSRSDFTNIKETLLNECIMNMWPKFTVVDLLKRLPNLNIS